MEDSGDGVGIGDDLEDTHAFGSLLSLSVTTVHGRMTVNFNYNEGVLGEETIDTLVAGVCGRLQQ